MKKKELYFRFKEYYQLSSEKQELFLIRIINNFAYKNKWYLGGCFVLGDIEDYHKGKIYVKSSKPNEETIFAIVLPITG